MDIHSLKNLADVAEFWRKCLDDLATTEEDSRVAYDMVRVIGSDYFHDWYDGIKRDPVFAKAFDYVSELEVPLGPDYYREAKWGMVQALVRRLSEKHVH